MNKVFKVIWSEARNAYVVVSEIAKNHGSKSCSTKKLLAMLIATGVMTCASMAPAMAADPPAEALKHSTVAAGYNITVTPKDNSDGGKEYNVDLKNDIYLAGDDPDALVSISGSKGTIWATGSVTVGSGVDGSVVMDGTTATVSGLGNTTTAYDGFANGKGKAATEEQLKEISEVAENANQGWNLSTNGGEASKVAPGETVDFSGDQNINISNDGTNVKVELNNDINLAGDTDFVSISGSKGTIWATGSVAAGNVVMDGHTETISGLSNTTTAYAGFANGEGKAATEEQLKEVATEAGKHTQVKAGTNVSVVPGETADGTHVYTVNADGTTVSGDSNVVVTAGAKDVNNVTNYGVKLNKDLKGIESVSNGSAKLALNGAAGTAGMINGKGASVYMQDGYTVINSKVAFDQNGKISGVAAGAVTADSTDAVNGSQLHAVATEAGKHSKVVSGNNINVEETDVDGQKFYKVNMNKDIMLGDLTGKNVSISGTNGTIEATGYIATKDRVYADKGAKLADIDVTGDTISNGDAKLALNGAAGTAGMINGKGASVYMQDGYTVINSKVAFDQNGKISGVAAGAITADSTDAVNGSQLHAVATEAGKHSKVVNGSNINVEEFDNDGQKIYKVNLNKDIMLGDLTGKNVSISGTNGTIETTGYIATKDRVYADKGAKLADIDVTGDTISNGDAKLALNGAAGTAGMINGKGASVYMQDGYTVINSKVAFDQNGKISGVAAGAVTADSTDAVNGSQLHAVATEAGKHSKVVSGNNINVEETDVDGQKFYKVNMNKDIILGDLTGKYVNISGTNGTI